MVLHLARKRQRLTHQTDTTLPQRGKKPLDMVGQAGDSFPWRSMPIRGDDGLRNRQQVRGHDDAQPALWLVNVNDLLGPKVVIVWLDEERRLGHGMSSGMPDRAARADAGAPTATLQCFFPCDWISRSARSRLCRQSFWQASGPCAEPARAVRARTRSRRGRAARPRRNTCNKGASRHQAMAAGLTAHVWSWQEWLTLPAVRRR